MRTNFTYLVKYIKISSVNFYNLISKYYKKLYIYEFFINQLYENDIFIFFFIHIMIFIDMYF
jgi:hypothetical protein